METTSETLKDLQRGLARDLDGHFEQLVLCFQRPLFVFVHRMSGCPEDAEEVVQDAFVRAYRALTAYDGDRVRSLSMQAWLYRICLNLLRNKTKRRRVVTEQLVEDRHEGRDASPDPIAVEFQQKERSREMHQAIATLPPKYRSAVLLRYMNDLSYAEIAYALSQPEGTVKSNVHRGLGLLRQTLDGLQGETT